LYKSKEKKNRKEEKVTKIKQKEKKKMEGKTIAQWMNTN
jgi:hypothetical protein